MTVLVALLALAPFAVFPLLVAAVYGRRPRIRPTRRTIAILAICVVASLHAYVDLEDKPDPGPGPGPGPGPDPTPTNVPARVHWYLHEYDLDERGPVIPRREWRRFHSDFPIILR